MPKSRIETEWTLLLAEFGSAGLKCVLARHEMERLPTAAGAMANYVSASEHWTDLVLKTHDFVRDCPP